MSSSLQKEIENFAIQSGFHLIGFTTPDVSEKIKEYFIRWVQEGKHAGLWYLEDKRRLMLRFNPGKLMEEVKSIIVFGVSYKDGLFGQYVSSDKAYISTYALRKDYHKVMKKKLKKIVDFIKEREPQLKARIFVDSAPVLERYFAQRAGLGFIGKNNFLINPILGGLIFLGEIFTNLEFKSSKPLNISCSECSLCVDSCPTGALSPYEVDLNLCISYHTIENKDALIPEKVMANMKNMVFGCDMCALSCPYNAKASSDSVEPYFGEKSLSELQGIPLEVLLGLTEAEFRDMFKGTPVLRAGYTAFLRNVIIAAYNSKNNSLLESARKKCVLLTDRIVQKTCIELGLLD